MAKVKTVKTKSKTSRLWIRNTQGYPDAMLTLSVVAFIIVTCAYLASLLETLTIGSFDLTFSEFNTGYATAVMLPLLTVYGGRRLTTAKYPEEKEKKFVDPNQFPDPKTDNLPEQPEGQLPTGQACGHVKGGII